MSKRDDHPTRWGHALRSWGDQALADTRLRDQLARDLLDPYPAPDSAAPHGLASQPVVSRSRRLRRRPTTRRGTVAIAVAGCLSTVAMCVLALSLLGGMRPSPPLNVGRGAGIGDATSSAAPEDETPDRSSGATTATSTGSPTTAPPRTPAPAGATVTPVGLTLPAGTWSSPTGSAPSRPSAPTSTRAPAQAQGEERSAPSQPPLQAVIAVDSSGAASRYFFYNTDIQLVKSGTVQPGSSVGFSSSTATKLVLENRAGTSFSLNGSPIDLGKPDQQVSLYLMMVNGQATVIDKTIQPLAG